VGPREGGEGGERGPGKEREVGPREGGPWGSRAAREFGVRY